MEPEYEDEHVAGARGRGRGGRGNRRGRAGGRPVDPPLNRGEPDPIL